MPVNLLMMVFLLLLLLPMPGSQAVTSRPHTSTSQPRMPRDDPTHEPCKPNLCNINRSPRRLFISEKEYPLTLMTSERIPHQILTQVFAIFLRDCLGYLNVHINKTNDQFDPKKVTNQMEADEPDENERGPAIYIPKRMINLEVWSPPGYNSQDEQDSEIKATSTLGVGGRFGWFLPEKLSTITGFTPEHWRSYTNPNSSVLNFFKRSKQEMSELSRLTIDPKTGSYYCTEVDGCKRGIYEPKWCQGEVCAVLFSSTTDISFFLHKQIEDLKMYVKVVWIGPNLNKEFLDKIWSPSMLNHSALVFHWVPSILLQPYSTMSVSFPPCADNSYTHTRVGSAMDIAYECKYEMHTLNKFIWNKLQRFAHLVYMTLDNMQITHMDYESIMSLYNKNQELSMNKLACKWIIEHQKTVEGWVPKNTRLELPIVAIIPFQETDESIIGPSNHKFKFLAHGNVNAFSMAVKAVNDNNTILTDYKLKPVLVNGMCEPDIVMKRFIKIVHNTGPNGDFLRLVGFVGPACTDTVEPFAGVAKHFNVPIISYGAEGAIFSGHSRYPYFFRTIPENKIFRNVYLQLFKKLGWNQMASLTTMRYSEYLTPLRDLLEVRCEFILDF
ncbi:unnamed protein product [Meganyctiphanes norvegica]|uniref:Receptor ligand binding region domain-containing protein n=1 Tax=Meganyctiphanes norvegica TaxID=48144 RepID=A0AAV2QB90_MEGNR